MPKKPGKSTTIFTLAGGAITAVAGIATTNASKPIGVILLVVGAIVLIFGLALGYAIWRDRQPSVPVAKPVDLAPGKLAAELDGKQREILELALPALASEVANVVGVPTERVRANLFAKLPGSDRLGMVQNLWFQMDYPPERTIQMDVGRGCAGLAFQSRNINRAIWKDGWGANDLVDNTELAKVNPDLRWILSVPIFGSADPAPKLVLNVDGLHETPTQARLAEAIGHLPRFANVVARTLNL
jgi:hypothetical protein